jgi:hypothetical protein
VATLADGDRNLIFGYFDGRPPAQAAADLFISILTGKTPYLGGYNKATKSILITTPPKPAS